MPADGLELIGSVANTTLFCSSFPEFPNKEIAREHISHTLMRMLEGTTQLVTVEGAENLEGIGKTTILAQFANRYSSQAVSIFIRPTSWFAYDPGIILRDLCAQLHWLVYGREIESDSDTDDTVLATLVYEFQRRCKRQQKPGIFIIDGLTTIPQDRGHVRDAIIGKLPFGLPQFRFLLSGDSVEVSKIIVPKLASKPYTLAPFSLEETLTYFEGLLARELVSEVFRISHGVPGYLARIRQLLESGTAAPELLEHLPTTMPELFAIEWRTVASAGAAQLRLLALLAHDRNKHSIVDLASIFSSDATTIRSALKEFTFLTVPADDQREVEFVSDTYRKYAAERLREYSDEVTDRVIEYLLRDPESEQALTLLPAYLQDAGRDEALLSYLSPEHFGLMLEKSELVTPVQERARIGVETALKLRRDEDLARLSLLSSVLSGVEGYTVSRREIEARLALGDIQSSIALAQAAVLKEDRLQLLALVARKLREKKISSESELVEQMQQLAKQVDFASFTPARAVELAGDLIYSAPELALAVLERSGAKRGAGDSTSLDWALARLSMQASFSDQTELRSAADSFKNRIKDPDVLLFSSAMSVVFGRSTPSEIIAEVDKITNPSNKLSLLRQWALYVSKEDSVAPVVEYTLDLGIKTTQYSPNATHLRELATPLPLVQDLVSLRKLVGMFDSQKATVESLGPTEDFVRLQLILAEAEAKYDRDAAGQRLEEVYLAISYIQDLAIKSACIARLTGTLERIDPGRIFESKNKLHSIANTDLLLDIKTLLAATGQHFTAVKKVIDALGTSRPKAALEVCLALNVQIRRDQALRSLIKTMLRHRARAIDFEALQSVINSFADPGEQQIALSEVVERLSLVAADEILQSILPSAVPLLWRVPEIAKAELRTRTACFLLQCVKRSAGNVDRKLQSFAEETLRSSWDAMDEDWRKVDAAFHVTSVLAPHWKELAEEFLSKAHKLRNSVTLENPNFQYGMCMRLASRSYSALLGSKAESEETLENLGRHIARFPSITSRLEIWDDVALRCIAHERLSSAKRIVEENVSPLLAELERRDYGAWCNYVALSAPALFIAHSKSTIELFSKLPKNWRDAAIHESIEFLCRKVPSTDPYQEVSGEWFLLKYTEVSDLLDLMALVDSDFLLHHYVEVVVNSARRQRPPFSQQQKASIAQKLLMLIQQKLPTKSGIQHQGWVIACKAEVFKLQRAKAHEWQTLIAELSTIPNTADSAYTASLVAANMWSIDPIAASKLFQQALNIADKIPSLYHRVDIYQHVADTATKLDPEFAKGCISKAVELTIGQRDSDFTKVQRDLIDLANILSPEFSSHLAAMIDNDPARAQSRTNAKKRLEFEKFRKKMLDEAVAPSELFEIDGEQVPRCAWDNLGALNAGRVEPVPIRHAREYMRIATKLPISDAYPIFAWSIENSSRRSMLGPREQAKEYLQGLFRGTIQAADLCAWMAEKVSGRVTRHASVAPKRHIVEPGNRDEAVMRLRDWLQANASEYIKIADQFIGPEEVVDILRLIVGSCPQVRVEIVTSRKYQSSQGVSSPWEDAYRLRWRLASDQEPPETRVVIAGLANGDSPLHDRWWITSGAGLRMGTSFNSLGMTKDSEITAIRDDERVEFETSLDECLRLQRKRERGEKVIYSSFTI